ncbi:MAG: peptide chain release factor N(5)-glutamine methyltransferase [Lachnospiraceae bacterium]|nr:peptide chain release factor N(5)-glutamine methyltransferase [Lachnospiraceae bacterium]
MTVREALEKGKKLLLQAGIGEAALDARLLLEHVTGLDRGSLLLSWAKELPGEQLQAYEALLARRASREPLQHIVGSVSFMGIDILCDGRALIPRQETELLAEQAIRLSEKQAGLTALDLCTGTGCIAIAMALMGRYLAVAATDVSREALTLAAENMARNKASVELLQGDLFKAVPDRRFDVIVSNPPYIASEVLNTLMPEVREHDPLMALDGGADGLAFYRRIAAEAPRHLNHGGRLLLEIGADQGAAVSALLAENGFADIRVLKDYGGLDRIVTAAGGKDV